MIPLPIYALALVLALGCAKTENRVEENKNAQPAPASQRVPPPKAGHTSAVKLPQKPAAMKRTPKTSPQPVAHKEVPPKPAAATLPTNHPKPTRESQALLTAVNHNLIPGVPVNFRSLLKNRLHKDDRNKLPSGTHKIRYVSPQRDSSTMLYAIALEMMGKTMDESITNAKGEVVIHILYPERITATQKMVLRFETITQKQFFDAYRKPLLEQLKKKLGEPSARPTAEATKVRTLPSAASKLPAPSKKSSDSIVTFDADYAAPSAHSEKLLNSVLPVLKPQKKVRLAKLLKRHLSEEQLDLSVQGTCDIAFVSPLKNGAGKLVAISFFILPHSFLKKPKKGFSFPYLMTLYPAQTGPGKSLELRIHEEECSGRYFKNITAVQPDPQKLGMIVLTVTGSGYEESRLDTFALVPLKTFFVWHKGVMQSTMPKALVHTDADKEAGCTSAGKTSHSWHKTKSSGIMLIETDREQSMCKEAGKLFYNCSQSAVVYHIAPSMQMRMISKAAELKKLMAAEPALVPKLKTLDKESSTPCEP